MFNKNNHNTCLNFFKASVHCINYRFITRSYFLKLSFSLCTYYSEWVACMISFRTAFPCLPRSQQLEHKQVPKRGTEPGAMKGKRSMLACHTRCKCSMETTRNSVKVKLGIRVMKLVESLIGWEVTLTGQGSEWHLTFVRGRLHIVEYPYRP